MALDITTNFAKTTIDPIASGATSVVLASVTNFPDPSGGEYNCVIWEISSYGNPADDPNREIVRMTAKSRSTYTVTRAQESTSDNNHNTGGATYAIANALTKKMMTDIESAINGKEPAKGADDNYVTNAEKIVIGNTSGTNTGDNAANTTANSYADGKVEDNITDGHTTVAPSGNAVFDALALKLAIASKASSAEINTGTDNDKYITSDALAGATIGKRLIQVKIFDDSTAVTTGDGKLVLCIPLELNGMNLVQAEAYCSTVSSSGTPTVQIRNVTDSADMLSTRITIDATEYTSYTATARSVVDGTHDDVATGDLIAIDVDVSGTGTKGLGVILSFALP